MVVPGMDSIHQMDACRLDRLWKDLKNVTIESEEPWKPALELFMKAMTVQQDEGVIIKLFWSLDCAIEQGHFPPK